MPMLFALWIELGARGHERFMERNDFRAIALQESGNGTDRLTLLDGFLQNLGVS
jgi:hypothetical protein